MTQGVSLILQTDETKPEADFQEIGRKLFAGECNFIWAAPSLGNLPPQAQPEIAFAGRSNVGKSSLLNALTNRKALARTSNTPGRTRELNFFALGGTSPETARLRLVDMPGYGYAAAGKDKVAAWTKLMQDYLRGRPTLLRVFVLIDGRHGLKVIDEEMLDLLDKSAVSYQIVLTKRDEVKAADADQVLARTISAISRRPAAFPEVIFTSSQTGGGVSELREAVVRLLAERGF
jgi:GTP-binding protein